MHFREPSKIGTFRGATGTLPPGPRSESGRNQVQIRSGQMGFRWVGAGGVGPGGGVPVAPPESLYSKKPSQRSVVSRERLGVHPRQAEPKQDEVTWNSWYDYYAPQTQAWRNQRAQRSAATRRVWRAVDALA